MAGRASDPDVWIVIPALDAANHVGAVVEDCQREGFRGRVIVVDDGSSDPTFDSAVESGAVTLRHARNRGKGEALRTGFELALRERADAVISMDADGQHVASEIPKLQRAWAETDADLVIGSRDHLFAQMVRRRRLANRASARLISLCAGVNVRDSQSGFRLYTRRFLTEVDYRSAGFAAESEMVVVGGRRGLKIAETPVRLGFVDGLTTSHYRPVLDSIRITLSVMSAYLRPGITTDERIS
ncbi:MAG: glycosyltransferase family 2 protein [Thermoanaerobaculia bacterium]|nr:glycosyltransferase family 2 protein [Thermoanaerobaculia bacterium]